MPRVKHMFRASFSLPLVKKTLQLLHHKPAADEKWAPLMQLGRLDIEDPLPAIGRLAARDLYNKGERVALV
jgi:hypothetical protein